MSGPAAKTPKRSLFADRVKLLGTEEAFRLGAIIREVEDEGDPVIRCNLGQPDFPLPAHIADAVVDALRRGLTTYCDPQGIPELRAAVAKRIGATHGLSIDPERVVVYPGARSPIGLAQQTYVHPGDEVLFPTPCYPLFESFVPYVTAKPVAVPLREEDGFTLTGKDLEAYLTPLTKLIYLNFPSNPTGGVASPEQLADLASTILEHTDPNVRVYSDEAYEAIVFDDLPHVSIASMPGMEARTIIAGGVSKTYSWTGGRVGWAVYPTVEEAQVHRNLNINYYASIPPYNQVGAIAALESDESPPIIEAMVAAFQRRRDAVVEELNRIPGIACQMPKGAFYAFPNVAGVLEDVGAVEAFAGLPEGVRTRTSPATLFQLFLLYRYRVATMDRRSFGVQGSEGQHFLRLSIANSEGELRAAVGRIAEASRDRDGFQNFVLSGRRWTL